MPGDGSDDRAGMERYSDNSEIQFGTWDEHPDVSGEICQGDRRLRILNDKLDQLDLPYGINEEIIEGLLAQLESLAESHPPTYWLMTARLTEISLICAGHYADNGEFTAAGDLLVNPRKIVIHPLAGPPMVKHRHGRLSDQLPWIKDGRCWKGIRPRSLNAALHVEKPPLLPLLSDRMSQSGWLKTAYLETVQERMKAVADTIGFLGAWSLHGMEAFYLRMRHAPTDVRDFVQRHLCRFDRGRFDCIGREIRQWHGESKDGSEFICHRADGHLPTSAGHDEPSCRGRRQPH